MQTETSPIAEITSKYINNTNRHIFLTGKAGTGKTTFLKNITQYTHKNVMVAAPTGIAAINAGGVTLHSLFQLPFGSFIPENTPLSSNIQVQVNTPKSLMNSFQMNKTKRNMLRELELLVIDEVSMLRSDLLDAIDVILRSVRRVRHKAFGGVQMLFIGDLLQLPPVVKDNEWSILSSFYKSSFFFDAKALTNEPPLYIELEKIYRQSDPTFINLLNNLRENKITESDVELLNKHYDPNFSSSEKDGFVHLTTHNRFADEKNKSSLEKLKGKSFYFDAIVEDDFSEYLYPIDYQLELKVGAQVMFIKNDYSGERRYFNGKIGKVSQLDEEEIIVSFNDGTDPTSVERYVWENKKYSLNTETNEIQEKLVGKFSQYPLKLAWAITVHKSQGLTFEKAIIDVARAFAPGQIYVALSRLTSLDGLVLLSKIPPNAFIKDPILSEFAYNKKTYNELDSNLKSDAVKYICEAAIAAFDFSGLLYGLNTHYSGYANDEKKTIKKQYKSWALKLLDETKPLQEVAGKFQNQLRRITYQTGDDSLTLLQERLGASKKYFEPLIKGLSTKILDLIKELSTQKRIKTYLNELTDLERLFFRQLQFIYKAESLVESILNNTEVSKESFKNSSIYVEREKLITVSSSKAKSKSKSKEKKVKKTNEPNTKEISYNLFKEGKSLEEIAKERGFAITTIEGHLAHFVQLGELDISKFLGKEQIVDIVKTIKECETTSLKALIEVLDYNYSYGELKMAVAYYQRIESENSEIK